MTGRIGVQIDPQTGEISDVDLGSPAERADLQPGDVLLAVAGRPLSCWSLAALRGPVGTEVEALVVRGLGTSVVHEFTVRLVRADLPPAPRGPCPRCGRDHAADAIRRELVDAGMGLAA